jgi:hypothetical protein
MSNAKINTLMKAIEICDELIQEYREDKRISDFLIMNADILSMVLQEAEEENIMKSLGI